jgi:hypothetical protein
MSTDIQHLGREDSDGAVIRGKCLVNLGHLPTDAGKPLYQLHFKSHFGEIQSGLNSRDAASDDKYVFSHNLAPVSNQRSLIKS